MPHLSAFIKEQSSSWKKLDTLVQFIEGQGAYGLSPTQLQELSLLYRAAIRDLAYAQTHFPNTKLADFLQHLVGRSHYQIFRPQSLTWTQVVTFFRHDVPLAAREHTTNIVWAAIIFLFGLVFGLAAVQLDEQTASLILPTWIIDDIHSHHMWTGSVFSAMPGPVVSTAIFTNNLTVAFLGFVGGLTCGLLTVWVLFLNGFMLGVVISLCATYGLLPELGEFIASHGAIEISSIIVSGGSGLVVANALLNPGQLSRSNALYVNGQSALRMVVGVVPVIVGAGIIEAFVSPTHIPAFLKIVLGLALGLVFWYYLLFAKLPNGSGKAINRV